MWTAPVASMPYGFQLGQVIGRPGGNWGEEKTGVMGFIPSPSHLSTPAFRPARWLAGWHCHPRPQLSLVALSTQHFLSRSLWPASGFAHVETPALCHLFGYPPRLLSLGAIYSLPGA